MSNQNCSCQDTKNIKSPDFTGENLEAFKQAQTAVMAGLAATAKRYAQIDDQNTPKNKEKGTFAYDTGDRSVFYTN